MNNKKGLQNSLLAFQIDEQNELEAIALRREQEKLQKEQQLKSLIKNKDSSSSESNQSKQDEEESAQSSQKALQATRTENSQTENAAKLSMKFIPGFGQQQISNAPHLQPSQVNFLPRRIRRNYLDYQCTIYELPPEPNYLIDQLNLLKLQLQSLTELARLTKKDQNSADDQFWNDMEMRRLDQEVNKRLILNYDEDFFIFELSSLIPFQSISVLF